MIFRRQAVLLPILSVLALLPAKAGTIYTYTTPPGGITETDNGTDFPVNATITFTVNNGSLTVTLMNNEANPFFNAQNISALSFQLTNGSNLLNALSGSTTTAVGTPVVNDGGASNIVQNTAVTPANASVTWYLENLGGSGAFGSGNTTGSGSSVNLGSDAFILSAQSGGIMSSLDSIIGPTNGSGVYTGTPEGTTTCTVNFMCNSGNPIAAQFGSGSMYTQDMHEFLYNSVTFTFSVPGLTTSYFPQNVVLGFGPDGPDADDLITLDLQTTPEPVSLVLAAAGLV